MQNHGKFSGKRHARLCRRLIVWQSTLRPESSMELLGRRRFTSQAEARMAIFSYIEGWYNPARRHSGIRYLSPIAYEMQILKETQTT